MPAASQSQRRYSVHGVDEAPSRAHLVEGASFSDAALQFVEDRHLEPHDDAVSLMVEDCETGDGSVSATDLAQILSAWGATTSTADLNNDGVVGAADLAQMLNAWGACP